MPWRRCGKTATDRDRERFTGKDGFMKKICIVSVVILLAACSAHRVRCRGALQPINKPVDVASPSKADSKDKTHSMEPRP